MYLLLLYTNYACTYKKNLLSTKVPSNRHRKPFHGVCFILPQLLYFYSLEVQIYIAKNFPADEDKEKGA